MEVMISLLLSSLLLSDRMFWMVDINEDLERINEVTDASFLISHSYGFEVSFRR